MAVDIPIFINSRDRLKPLRDLVSWLEWAGANEIYIIDNDSAYEPFLEWYEHCRHHVIRLGENVGKNALWDAQIVERAGDRYFAYSDSDVVPDPACPSDAIDVFIRLLGRYQGINKAGFGIRYDDIPDHYSHKDEAVFLGAHEYSWPLERNVYYAAIDTQFAVYRPHSEARPHRGARTGYPYVAGHHSFYLDFENMNEEDAFYARRSEEARHSLRHFTLWATDEMSALQAPPLPNLPDLRTRLRWRLRGRRAVRLGNV